MIFNYIILINLANVKVRTLTGQDVKNGETGELLVTPPFGQGGKEGFPDKGEKGNFPDSGKV